MSGLNCSEETSSSKYSSSEEHKIISFANGGVATAAKPSLTNNFSISREDRFSSAAASNMTIKSEYQDNESSSTDDSSSGLDWGPNTKALRISDGAVDYSMTSSFYNSTDSSTPNTSIESRGSAGPRRHCREKMSQEEEEKRSLRRERNKLAAAKCRQKRVDQTNVLLAETKSLEEEQLRLEHEIKSFQQEKEELEFILDAHRIHCNAGLIQDSKVFPNKATNPGNAETTSDLKMSVSRQPKVNDAGTSMAAVTSSGIFVVGLQPMISGHAGVMPVAGLPAGIVQAPGKLSSEEGSQAAFGLSFDAKLTML